MSSGEAGSQSAGSQAALGFLTVLEHDEHGLVGGYLLLNMAGRPLEFHCTVPVRPNRAQQILFGPTLRPYLYGEQIGQALLAKMLRDDRALGSKCSVLTASHTGALLYPRVGYERIGTLFMFVPRR